jgi:cytochrome c oxidase assembly protein subunit 11
MHRQSRNVIVASVVGVVICCMVGASFAAVPLYRMFCAATGYGGTPNFTEAGPTGRGTGSIRVRFNADIMPTLAWRFRPDQPEIQLELGDEQVAFFNATNLSSEALSGVAVYNVTPENVGKYFHKTACFCLNQQTLTPHQAMEFPVSFWVDPAIRSDPNTANVKVITLSYTFFPSFADAAGSKAFSTAGPHVGSLADAQAARK